MVAAVVSYEHASALVQSHGESGWTGRLIPLMMDGLIYATFDGDAGLSAAGCAVAPAGAVAARLGHCHVARSERWARLGP